MPIRIAGNKIIFNDLTEMSTAPVSQNVFPSGTITVFQQTNAPTGWTKITTYNNYALRVVSGTATVSATGLDFTSVFASRIPTGSVNVFVGDHTTSNTTSNTTGLSLQSASIGGSFNGNTASSTVSISGTTNNAGAFSGNTSSSTFTLSGTTAAANNGFESHTHSYNRVSSLTPQTTTVWLDDSNGIAVQVINDIGVNYSSSSTGGAGSGSNHSHSVSLESNPHNHSVSIGAHSHSFSASNVGAHAHTYAGTFTSNPHSHSVSETAHAHSVPIMSHTASGFFSGSPMDFSIKYVDVILASKN